MLINKKFNIHKHSEGKWILEINDRHFHINKKVFDLLNCLQKAPEYYQAFELHKRTSEQSLSFESFCDLVNYQLNKLGLLENIPQKLDKHSYLKLKFELLPADLAAIPGKIFAPLFYPILFFILSIFFVVFHTFVTVPIMWRFDFSMIHSGWPFVLIFLSVVFHEFGHIAACRHFGVQHKGIGIGFYFIFPVAYSNISAIWALPKKSRQVVNLAGVFMEMMYAMIIALFGLILNNNTFIQISALIFFTSLLSLNPLIRHDGYWVLSDLLDIPNLMSKSISALKKVAKKLFGRASSCNQVITSGHVFLSIYALLNISIGFIFLTVIYLNQTKAIFEFPISSIIFLTNLISGKYDKNFMSFGSAIALVFYILLIKALLTSPSLFQKIKENKSK